LSCWSMSKAFLIFCLFMCAVHHSNWALILIKILVTVEFCTAVLKLFFSKDNSQIGSPVPRWIRIVFKCVETIGLLFIGQIFLAVVWLFCSYELFGVRTRWIQKVFPAFINKCDTTLVVLLSLSAVFFSIWDTVIWLKRGNFTEISFANHLMQTFKFQSFYSWVYSPHDWYGLHLILGWIFKCPAVVFFLILIILYFAASIPGRKAEKVLAAIKEEVNKG
jgi:hypothetical protein